MISLFKIYMFFKKRNLYPALQEQFFTQCVLLNLYLSSNATAFLVATKLLVRRDQNA